MFAHEKIRSLFGQARVILVLACGLPATAPGIENGFPELPRVRLEVAPQSIQKTGKVHTVTAGTDLQRILNDAKPGDEIVLEAGTVYTGNFVLKRKSGSGWITLRSSAMDRLPPGRRVRPEHAEFMPKLVSPNTQPVLTTEPGAAFYQVVGMEMTHGEEVAYSHGIVGLGGEHSALDQVPHNLIFDRVYVHGHARQSLKRGFALNSASTVIANSWVAECHVVGQDAQAIGGWNGPGPYKIYNNYLEGSGENLMFGGADPRVAELVPSDIEIQGNHLRKPLNWRKEEPGFIEPAWTV
jgi:hypothetical protein